MKLVCSLILILIILLLGLEAKTECEARRISIDIHSDGTVFITQNYDLLCPF